MLDRGAESPGTDRNSILKKIRILLVVFIVGLVLSGVTALALETELTWLSDLLLKPVAIDQSFYSSFYIWIVRIRMGLHETNARYPFIAYGTDWLAFAHIVIAILFVGPLMDPVRNNWIIRFGLIACVLVIPFAFICGTVREIPLGWKLIDCSFGILGFVVLALVWRLIRKLDSV